MQQRLSPRLPILATVALSMGGAWAGWAQQPNASAKPTAAQVEFFENKIRPVLATRCFGCHSAQATDAKGGLRLDTREGVRKGGESGPSVIPGDPAKSLLLQALKHEGLKMPPSGKLPAAVIADFETWIKQGAPDPRDPAGRVIAVDLEKGKRHWSFQPLRRIVPPPVRAKEWPRDPVDQFVMAQLEGQKLQPVVDADPGAWLRRVTFDLTGVPPTPEELQAFQSDPGPAARRKVVDRLLASPGYGVRWGRHWLDVARYAETSGKDTNTAYPHAWRYRDYVIASFQSDKPFDRFVKEQLAGDLLPFANDRQRAEQLVATGFLAIGPKSHQQMNPLQFELDLVDEQIDATTQAFLGLTVACARCHDHKFDPIPQADYYALAGIFRSTETCYGTVRVINNRNPAAMLVLPSASEGPPHLSRPSRPLSLEAAQRQVLAVQQQQERMLIQIREQRAAGMTPDPGQFIRIRTQSEFAQSALREFDRDGKQLVLAVGAREKLNPADSPVFDRGEPDKPGPVVRRGTLQVIDLTCAPISEKSSGRLELAEWVASPKNPLTARVMVNRIWLHLFGQGLVPSVDNFGATGQKPSHPELLDYLAQRFVDQGWSVKSLIRELVLTRTYGLSTRHHAGNFAVDPDNVYLWRATPRRLDAEAIRDSMLACAGVLTEEAPAGSLIAQQGEGPPIQTVFRLPAEAGSGIRSAYLSILRDNLPEPLTVFDFANPGQVTGARESTSTATQALYLMNSPLVLNWSQAFADRLTAHSADLSEQIRHAYLLSLGRTATETELQAAVAFVQSRGPAPAAAAGSPQPGTPEFRRLMVERLRARFGAGGMGDQPRPGGRPFFPGAAGAAPAPPLTPLGAFCHALFQSSEFRYLD